MSVLYMYFVDNSTREMGIRLVLGSVAVVIFFSLMAVFLQAKTLPFRRNHDIWWYANALLSTKGMCMVWCTDSGVFIGDKPESPTCILPWDCIEWVREGDFPSPNGRVFVPGLEVKTDDSPHPVRFFFTRWGIEFSRPLRDQFRRLVESRARGTGGYSGGGPEV